VISVQLGLMNDPAVPWREELRRIAADGFDFVDLTLEPPGAWPVDGAAIRRALGDLGLDAVGHTAPYLPIASPLEPLRRQALALLEEALDAFAAVGVRLVNVHPDRGGRRMPAREIQLRNAEAVAWLADAARARGQRIMVENMPRAFAEVDELRPLLDAAPDVGFHLDVGHAHLDAGRRARPRLYELLDAFSDRLAHVHVHDNLGAGDDLHLPLGAGTIDWPGTVRALRAAGWDGTVTLEVFSPEREHARTSARLWRTWWSSATRG
jgi:sugar phosphate isomerase/epimerase